MSGTLIDNLNWWAMERADVPAVVVGDDQVTYRQLKDWAESVGEWLVELGLQPGDRVAVMATNSMQWVVLAQATMLAGGILAPVSPRFTFSEAAYLLVERYRCKFVFHDAERKDIASKVGDLVPGTIVHALDELERFRGCKSKGGILPASVAPDTEIVIIPTSGSTGRPKGVCYSHRSMSAYLSETALAKSGAIDQGRVLIFAPLATSAGYVVMTQYLGYGGTLHIEQAFDPVLAVQTIQRHLISIMMGAPIFFERMAAVPGFAEADLSSLRYCMVGGAPVTRTLLEAWLAKGVLLRQLYGQTEVGGQATINTDDGSIAHPEKCGRGSIYTRVAVMDPLGNFLPPNTPGEIVVKGPGVMTRYWDDPEATAATIVDGWIHTGDIGMLDEDGLLTFLDRMKDIIISGGMNISSAEVERVISEYAGVQEVAVIAAHDDRFGETPLAIIHGLSANEIPEVVAHCNTHLSNYKVPRYIVVSEEPLPRLATGKLAKPVLRERYADADQRLDKVR